MQYLMILFLMLGILSAASCGFQLQSTRQIEKPLKTLRLSIDDKHALLTHAIREKLKLNNIKLISTNLQNVPILKIISLSENTKTLSIYRDGKSLEKQLNLWVNGEIILSNDNVYPIQTRINRAFFDNSLETLGKEAEKQLLKREMYEQLAHQLIRKLLIVHNSSLNQSLKRLTSKKTLSEDKE